MQLISSLLCQLRDVGLGSCQLPGPEGKVPVAALEAKDHHGQGGPTWAELDGLEQPQQCNWAAHYLLCGLVSNRSWTITGSWPGGWGCLF